MSRRAALQGLAAAAAGTAAARAEAVLPADKSPIVKTTPLGMFWPMLDPFLFCAHHDDTYPAGDARLGPAASLAGRDLGQDFAGKDGWRMYHGLDVPGFPGHPHRGFETVTIVRRGLVDHSDSLGGAGRYGGGDVQWLTAGAGVQHAEMFPLLERSRPNPLELFQVWLNLPRADKFAEPHYTMLWREKIPQRTFGSPGAGSASVRVIAGALGEVRPLAPPPRSWAARPDSDLAIWDIALSERARWTLPAARPGTNRVLYFFSGSGLRVAGRSIASWQAIQLVPDRAVELASSGERVELLLLQGRPIGEPVVQEGPFVMSTREEIRQAFADYRRTQFGGWPWPSADPVHPREAGRFGRHADGQTERPA